MNFYQNIKEELIKNETYKRVKDYSKNKSDIKTYYNVGKLLSEAGKKYGEEVIKKYSKKLIIEVGKSYTIRTLFRIKQFYNLFKDEKVSTMSTLLTWSHYVELLPIEDLPSFLKELGKGFSFIENEYKIKMGNSYNYIDMLLFNYIYNCFVVIELKTTELKKEHIGQIETYMNYIDKNIRNINQEKTVGIIICKKDNKFIMEYCSDDRIISRNYILS